MMDLILVASATGGSAKTTTAVRLAEQLTVQGCAALVVDLSPYPTAEWVRERKEVPILRGRTVRSPEAIRELLDSHGDVRTAAILDTGRFDDPIVDDWLPHCRALFFTTRCDSVSISALKGVWRALESRQMKYDGIKFLGFLPVMFQEQEEAALLARLKSAAGKYLMPAVVPWDPREQRRSQEALLEDLKPLPDSLPHLARGGYAHLARLLIKRLDLAVKEPTAVSDLGSTGEERLSSTVARILRRATPKILSGQPLRPRQGKV